MNDYNYPAARGILAAASLQYYVHQLCLLQIAALHNCLLARNPAASASLSHRVLQGFNRFQSISLEASNMTCYLKLLVCLRVQYLVPSPLTSLPSLLSDAHSGCAWAC